MEIDWDKIAEMEEEMSKLWEVDTKGNLLDNLETLDLFLTQLEPPWKWKWAVIAIHQALYTALIAALAGTSPQQRTIEKDVKRNRRSRIHQIGAARAWRIEGASIEEIAQRLNYPPKNNKPSKTFSGEDVEELLKEQPRLISIKEALRRMRSDKHSENRQNNFGSDYLPWSNSRRLQLSSDQEEAVNILINSFRNEFEHFVPKTWIIEPALFPPMLTQVMHVIRFITLESNCIMYDEEGQEERIQSVLASIEKQLESDG